MWPLFRGYRWLAIWLAISLVGAVVYDYYKNKPAVPKNVPPSLPSVSIRNPIELQNPSDTTLGDLAGSVSATELFEEFLKNQEVAKKKYLGKTYLITGLILESFDLELPEAPSHRAGFELDIEAHITAGIMLLPETPGFLSQFESVSLDEIRRRFHLPMRITAEMDPRGYENRYAKLLEVSDDNLHRPHTWSYDFYSDDFSFMSEYGGVYCMFQDGFQTSNPYGSQEEKKKVAVKCKIREYKHGGTEEIPEYKLISLNGRSRFDLPRPPRSENSRSFSIRKTKPTVIAVGCVGINYEQ